MDVETLTEEWTRKNDREEFCIRDGRLMRRTAYPAALFGGYRLQYVSLKNARLVQEWLS